MNKLIVLSILFLSLPLQGATYINWGIAQDYPGGGSYSDVQTYSMGIRKPLLSKFDGFIELGGWKDPGHYTGAKPGEFVAGGLILDLKLTEKYVSYSLGPCLITPTDTLLGGNFQIYHKFAIGYRDTQDKRIGLFLKHFSDAGMVKPNYGRNFLGLEISF